MLQLTLNCQDYQKINDYYLKLETRGIVTEGIALHYLLALVRLNHSAQAQVAFNKLPQALQQKLQPYLNLEDKH
jgi:hypothetical protein